MDPRGGSTRSADDPRDAAGAPAAGGSGTAASAARVPFAHAAFFYRTVGEYTEEVGRFIRAGLGADEQVLVAVPGPRALELAADLGVLADSVVFADITTVGRNPGRILSAMHAFAEAHSGRAVRYVAEPACSSQTAAERHEVVQHEALVNVAFAGQQVQAVCPYDAAALEPRVLADAERSHPAVLRAGRLCENLAFAGPAFSGPEDPLPDPPAGLAVLTYRDEPALARNFARDRAKAAGLREPRLTDLVIAVGELAANTLRHTDSSGSVRVWPGDAEVICEVRDSGHIGDVLAGRLWPDADAGRGHGLWVVHQVCDLVEMRTGVAGTTFRLHMRLGP
jgi:anti-sigma regulatory factor (Ser/Thr protein kinase)